MKLVEHKFTLDVNQTASQVSISVKKGDTARRLLIHLTESGYPCHLSKDCYAVFSANKPDGHVIFNNCTIEDCVIGYDFTAQTVAAVGLVNCEIIIYGAMGVQLTSASFDIIVEESTYAAVESSDEANALASLIQEIKALRVLGLRAPAIICQAEGEGISLTDSSDETLQGLHILGKSKQDGNPTPDNPVEIESVGDGGSVEISVIGKNLLQSKATKATVSGVTFTVNEDGSVTVNGTNNGTTDAYIRLVGTWGSTNNIHMLPKQNLILSGGSPNCLLNMFLFNSNGESTKGAFEVGVDSVTISANLLHGQAGFTVYPTVKPGVTVNETIYPMLRLASIADGNYESCKVQPLSTAVPEGCALPGLPVTSGGNYTDSNGQQWICDEIDLGRGVYVKRLGTAVLAGNSKDNYTLAATYGKIVRFDVKGVTTYARSDIAFCTHLPTGTVGAEAEICNIHGLIGYPIIQILSSRLESADVSGLAEYLAKNPMTIQHVLKTPIETALTEEDKAAFAALYTYKPSTFIYNDAGAYMAAEYVADTKTYIDNKGSSTTAGGEAKLVDATVE